VSADATLLDPAEPAPGGEGRRLEPKDYASDQEVRWCPGCGDYAILKAVEKALAELGADPDRTVFVSGIGCAARFPHYLATYGFHGIHGRAPAIATGIKLAKPELDVWVVGGDGDMLAIGTNHLVHALRRDLDLVVLIVNNAIYGLTKGQASPTTPTGTRTPSTPSGVIERPLSACEIALAAGARFVARSVDVHQKQLPEILVRARRHPGAAMVEILQNCVIYADGAWEAITEKAHAAEAQLLLRHGEPLLFADGRKGLAPARHRAGLEVVEVGPEGWQAAGVLVHDERDRSLATLLAALEPPMPVALGVLYADPAPASYEQLVREQIAAERARAPGLDLATVMRRAPTWTVPG
jgi:2-oxoglutarate ferredoxin oxidoreductase subunit beta